MPIILLWAAPTSGVPMFSLQPNLPNPIASARNTIHVPAPELDIRRSDNRADLVQVPINPRRQEYLTVTESTIQSHLQFITEKLRLLPRFTASRANPCSRMVLPRMDRSLDDGPSAYTLQYLRSSSLNLYQV